ncbi:MAG: hypothetical protein R3F65_01405 [bacterium]|nr:hypothetical protein [Myxococcales bacterium]
MSHPERMVRIQLEVPLSLVARIDALDRGRRPGDEPPGKAALYLDALRRGLTALEAGEAEAAPRPGPHPADTERVVLRGDRLAYGTRSGEDRRGDERGLDAGRRAEDVRRVRRAFIDEVMRRIEDGESPASIAEALNAAGRRTARGNRFGEAAIEQLVHRERARRIRGDWRAGPAADEESSGG